MIKKSVGRPKLLSREHVINTAFNEYWLHGINNVPLSKVALLAGVSRPGIYIEFTNEDLLKCEVLKKYFNESAGPVFKNYDNYNDYPNHLLNHFDAIIIAVSHSEFIEMGADAIHALGKNPHLVYDLKYVLPASASDLRL